FEHNSSGICEFLRMEKGWKEAVSKLKPENNIANTDKDIRNTVISWLQEEKNMALILSKRLGLFVKIDFPKIFINNFQLRIDKQVKTLIEDLKLFSTFKLKKDASDFYISVDFRSKSIIMEIESNVPEDKTIRGQLGWIKKQIDTKSDDVKKIMHELEIKINTKHTKGFNSHGIDKIELFYDELKDKKIINYKIAYVKELGKDFIKPNKFVEIIEKMLLDFYTIIVQHVKNPPPINPKIKEPENPEISSDSI
ncbi:MAG: hypothetical protein KKD38_07460, partial [Candidatus Delongbacteria bacterium]|nr:hypothetical protein [Candidatus Delongbacteria bacterium]